LGVVGELHGGRIEIQSAGERVRGVVESQDARTQVAVAGDDHVARGAKFAAGVEGSMAEEVSRIGAGVERQSIKAMELFIEIRPL
jgi:hypothetical protein